MSNPQSQTRGWLVLSLVLLGLTPILLLVLYLGVFLLWPESTMNALVEWIGTEIVLEMRGLDQQEKAVAKGEIARLLNSMFQNRIEHEQFLEVINMIVKFRADQVFDEAEVTAFLTLVHRLNDQTQPVPARQSELLLQVPTGPQELP